MGTLRTTYTPVVGGCEITIGGVDVSSAIKRFSLDHGVDDLPKVFLELGPRGVPEGIDVDAIVHVREVVQEDPADACRRFLEPLDPAEFEKACLAAMEAGGPATFGEAALAVLKAYTEGRPSA